MENLKTIEGELTSTMGNLLSTSEDDKNEASDSTPTSSTDAFTTTTTSQIAADDPISSTSSDVLESKKSTEKVNDVAHSSTHVISSGPVMTSIKDTSMGDNSSLIVSEKDLLDMNITDTSTEKITENVDDIVQDLENLLGEPTESFDFTIRSKDTRSILNVSQNKDISADIDAFSAELQMLEEQSTIPRDVSKTTPFEATIDSQKNVDNQNVDERSNVASILPNANQAATTEHVTHAAEVESSQSENQNAQVLIETEHIKPDTIEKLSSEHIENCQFEISANSANTELISVQKSELEVQDVTSTYSKSANLDESTDLKSEDAEMEEHDVQQSQENLSVQHETLEDNSKGGEESTKLESVATGLENPNIEKTESLVSDDIRVVEDIRENMCSKNDEISVDDELGEEHNNEIEPQKMVAKLELNLSEECERKDESSEISQGVEPFPEELVQPPIELPTEELTQNKTEQDLFRETDMDFAKDPPKEEELVVQTALEPSQVMEFESNFQTDSTVNLDQKPDTQEPDTKFEEMVMKTEKSVENATNEDVTDNQTMQKTEEDESTSEEAAKSSAKSDEIKQTDELVETKPEVDNVTNVLSDKKGIEQDSANAVVEEERVEETMAETTSQDDFEIIPKLPPLISDVVDHDMKPVSSPVLEEQMVGVSTDVSPMETQISVKDTDVEEIDDQTDTVEHAIEKTDSEEPKFCEEIQKKSEFSNHDFSKVISEEDQTAVQTSAQITNAPGNSELQTLEPIEQSNYIESIDENRTFKDIQLSIPVLLEESKPEENVEIPPGEIPIEDTNIESANDEVSNIAPVDFIPENLEMPSHSLAEDLDLLVQNAVSDEPMSSVLSPVQSPTNFEDKPAEVPTSSVDSLKSIEEGVMGDNVLPLAMDDVSDLDVLNAISTLSDNKSNLIPEMEQDVQESDALLSSSTLDQSVTSDVPFESNIETALPTVDEIFAEPSQQSQMELQDDNLETLLAVASLQNVDYSIPPVEDFTPPIEQSSGFDPEELAPSFVPVEESKIDETVQSLLETKEPSNSVKSPEIVENVDVVEKSTLEKRIDKIEPIVHDTNQVTSVVEQVKSDVEEVMPQTEHNLKEPLVINIDDTDKGRVYSPKITIKPIKPPEEEVEAIASSSGECENKGSLKMTITKQPDNTHSILKIYDPNDDNTHNHEDQSQLEPSVPKLIIKPIVQPNEQPQSPKMSTRSSKVFSPSSSQRSASPRITIKPIPKPDESVAPLKITIKPVLKPDESHKQKHSPKLTIKPIIKPEEESGLESKMHSPRVTIKPIVKPEEIEQVSSPRITIRPIIKPTETVLEPVTTTPRVTIKPVVKPSEKEKNVDMAEQMERSSPKITIKPIMKPQEPEPPPCEDHEESVKERIVLKINKGTIPGSSKELRKREVPIEEEKSEKLAKIKVKFSKEGGHPQIVQDQFPSKRAAEQQDHDKNKRQRIDTEQFLPGVTITPIGPGTHSKLKEMLSRHDYPSNKVVTIDDDDDEVTIVEEPCKSSPIVISEESNQDSINAAVDVRDPISEIPVFEITPDSVKTLNPQPTAPVAEVPAVLPAPRKRGRPRKVPLQVREDFKDPKEEEPKPVVIESTRPKRSCRGQSVRTTLGIKPRKPRGPGRGRGSKRGMGTRSTPTPPETPPKVAKEPKLSGAKLKELKEDSFLLNDKSEVKTIEIDDGLQKSPSNSLLAPPQSDTSTTDRADIVMYEEETRMSAETSSRAQTPAKQVVTTIPTVDLVEESQSSVQSIQSTATTESVKVRRGPRLEVHQEPEGAVISADQLAEYYWMGGGPYMLQEQVAQFLGIKSFKRKYPNIARRVVDMQERDFIRESGLAGEAMCDLGLTAVNSSDILDIMYSDFQDKYEEYCKHQRDRQAKDLINKQKALSLAASQEKAKMDITQQAVQSAASWNASFNKARRDQRKSCMDLQTLTIHFPKGKMKQINKPKVGYYPVALVPGQFTDYYKEFTPTEINNLPLNTMCYDTIVRGAHQEMECDSQTDGSGSESDTSTSDSDSSYSGSSDAEDCTLCKPTPKRVAAAQ